jgi:PAS domain S-box-containing protein
MPEAQLMNAPLKVLVVDDEEAIRRNFRSFLEDHGYRVTVAADGEEGMAAFSREQPSVVLTDLRMGKMNGLELVAAVHGASPDTPLIVVSGTGTVRDAVAAIRLGAWDYVLKPLQEEDELLVVINRTLERRRLVDEVRHYRQHLEELVNQKTAELNHSNRELALLNRVMTATAAEVEPKEVLRIACLELAQVLEVPQASACLLNDERTAITIVAEYAAPGRPSALNAAIRLADNPMVSSLLALQEPLISQDAQNDPRIGAFRELILRRNIVSLLELPLVIEGEIAGCLIFSTIEPRSFTPGEVELARRVAGQVAAALVRARLSETRRRLITAIEQTPESIVITDTTGCILYVNPAFEQITGYARSEAIGQNARLLKSGQHDAVFYQELWSKISAGGVWRGGLINKRRNGMLYTEDVVIAPVRDNHGVITNYIAVKRDITEQKKLEAQFLRLQRVESVGRLANGIAHDLNNILTPVLMSAGLMARADLRPEDRECVQLIDNCARRGAEIVKQLLLYSRGGEGKVRELDVGKLVQETARIVQETFPKSIVFRLRLPGELWPIAGDPTQLHQVLLNLCVNARDAMPEGGTLEMGAEHVELDELSCKANPEAKAGTYVALKVADTGTGIPPGILDKIFEPFFTTKEVGEGTGLGLATVMGIVKSHGGFIEVESRLGQGTQFVVYLPTLKSRSGRESAAPTPAAVRQGAGEWILVVEDEEPIRRIIQRVLERNGYRVLMAGDGNESLAIYSGKKAEIKAVILDMWMPSMDGLATIRALAKLDPAVRILATSGLPEMRRQALEAGTVVRGFLPKPWHPYELLAALEQVLR